MNKFHAFCSKLKRDLKGSVAIIAAVAAPTVFVTIGLAVDYARLEVARKQAQTAIDSAALIAASEIVNGNTSKLDIERKAREFFDANISGETAGDGESSGEEGNEGANNDENSSGKSAPVAFNNFSITIDAAESSVIVATDVEVRTLMSALLGFETLASPVFATTSYNADELEIAFVLDVTGSMKSGNRIGSLKIALNSAIETLLPKEGVNTNRVRVSLIPYSTSVNLGAFHETAVGANTRSANSPFTCVTERLGVNAFNDVVPVSNQSSTLYQTSPLIDAIGDIRRNAPTPCPVTPVRPLTNDRDVLLADVASFRAEGYTGGHMGVDWGINTISGEFGNFWGTDAAPKPYSDPNVRKVLVVMTDGAFNTAFNDPDDTKLSKVLGKRREPSEEATSKFCDFAKKPSGAGQGPRIEIFTINYLAGKRARNLLQPCATPDSDDFPGPHYFEIQSDNANPEALTDVFNTIARRVLKVLVSS